MTQTNRQPRPTDRTGARPASVAYNSVINLVGLVAPILAALVAFPLLNRYLGTERVGLLTLAWALIGYFSLFDLGIGRALTKLVAERLSSEPDSALARLIWTALLLMLVLGGVGGAAMAAGAPWLARTALKVPVDMRGETVTAIRLLAVGVPLVVTTAGLRGILEAQGRFFVSNVVRAPLGVWLLVGPLVVIPFGSRSLVWVMALLLVGRLVAAVAYALACLRGLPILKQGLAVDRRHVGELLRFGGWMTISNLISPVMVYMDRFLLGNRISLDAVAWYATPFEVVTKVLLVPAAIVAVLFPMFSALSVDNTQDVTRLNRIATRYVGLALFLPCFAMSLFAPEALTAWLGSDFASHSARVAQLLAFGCWVNGIGYIPFALLQGAGRPDITARIHVLELPLYLGLVVMLTAAFGIDGTALAWVLRVVLDLAILAYFAARLIRSPPNGLRSVFLPLVGIVLFAFSLVPFPLVGKLGVFVVVALGEAYVVWAILLDRDGLGDFRDRTAAFCGLRRRSW